MPEQKRVLVVENRDSVRQQYITGLKFAGFSVNGARDLQEALRLTDEVTHHVALIDLMLNDPESTELNGLEVVKRLKQEIKEGTKAIVVSAQKAPQTAVDTVYKFGVDYYLDKSVLIDAGMSHLIDLVTNYAEEAEISRYGMADNVLALLTGSSDVPQTWEHEVQSVLKPRQGYIGLIQFFEGFCDPMAPLLPHLDFPPTLKVNKENQLLDGRFWSKALGAPILIIMSNARNHTDPSVLGYDFSYRDERSMLWEHEKNGVIGRAYHLQNASRSEFAAKMEQNC